MNRMQTGVFFVRNARVTRRVVEHTEDASGSFTHIEQVIEVPLRLQRDRSALEAIDEELDRITARLHSIETRIDSQSNNNNNNNSDNGELPIDGGPVRTPAPPLPRPGGPSPLPRPGI